MHDQIFWTADRDVFSSFQRVSSAIVSVLLVAGIVFGVIATASGIA